MDIRVEYLKYDFLKRTKRGAKHTKRDMQSKN